MRNDFDPLRYIPPELLEIHDRLTNWARWSRDRRAQGHCRSVEWRYKSTDVWGHDDPPGEPVDILDAEKLFTVVQLSPERYRRVLHWYYIQRYDVRIARRKLGLTKQGLADELNRARRVVRNRSDER